MTKKKRKSLKKIGNKIILGVSLGAILLVLIIIEIIFSLNKKLVCTSAVSKDGVTEKNNITFKLNNDKIKNINVRRTFVIKKDSKYYGYLSVIKSSLSTAYKNSNLSYKLSESTNGISFDIIYNKEASYILNGNIVSLSDDVVSITTVSQDLNKDYFTVDLSEKYTVSDLKKIALKQNYNCR